MSHLRLQIALGPRIAVVAFLLQLSCLVAGAQSPANGVPGAGSGAPARRVRLLLELTSAYQSNPWQLDSGVSPSRTDGANFSASAGFRSRRTQFQLAGYAGVARSAQFPELNRETEGGQLTVTRTLGARVQVAGTAGVRSALALDLAYGAPLSRHGCAGWQ